MSWAFGPMLGYDCESTGVNVDSDRIVTATIAEIHPRQDGERVEPAIRSTVIDPGIPVPDGAAKVHGWTTERVQAEGKPPASELDWIATDLTTALTGNVPVVIANAPYDLTILDRELRRHDLATLHDRLGGRPLAPVIDPMCIDKALDRYRPGKRTLTALCETYGVRLDGAHDATFDALAACRVVYRLGQRGQMPANRLAELYGDRRYPNKLVAAFQALGRMSLAELHEAQKGWYAEQATSLAEYFRRQANEEAHKAEIVDDDAVRETARQDAEELRRRADDVSSEWPVRPWTGAL